MPLETGTYINDLVISNPPGTDAKSQGDDHLRLIKTVSKNTFPNASKPFRFPVTKSLETAADSPYSQLTTELNTTYLVNAAGGNFTLNLLTAASAGDGFVFQVKRTDSTTNLITLDPAGAETINGLTNITVLDGAIVVCNGSAWFAFQQGPVFNALIEEPSVDATADYLPFFDASANLWKKVLIEHVGPTIGMIADFAGTTAPSNWLFAFGQDVSRTTYARLFARIGTTFGVGDGSTTFGLPDCRGRCRFGKDDMGGVAAGRITAGAAPGINGTVLGATGGVQEHLLTGPESGVNSHTHADSFSIASGGSHQHSVPADVNGGGANSAQRGNVVGAAFSTTGSDGAHSHTLNGSVTAVGDSNADTAHTNVPPTIILNTMIFAGL